MSEGTWRTFQLMHVLDPNVSENKDFEKWSGSKWRKWLKTREEENLRVRGSQQRQFDSAGKQVNSILIASPQQVLDAFKKGSKRYDFFGRKYWSAVAFPMFLVNMSGNSDEVLRCAPVYFVATLDNFKRPIRFKMFNKCPNTNTRNQCSSSTVVPDTNSAMGSLKKLSIKLSA